MKTVHVFLGADLRGQHNSLKKLCSFNGIKLDDLKDGEAVIFINSAKNKLKAYSYNGVLSYIRFDDPRRGIDLNSLDELPKAFNSKGELDYSKALRKTLEKKLKLNRFEELELI